MPINEAKAGRIAAAGLLVSVGLVLHYAESLLPVFQIVPGLRLGLANIATLLAFSWYGMGFALLTGLLRCVLSGVFAGAITTVLYSSAGTLAGVLAMALTKRIFPRGVSTVGRSMLGAFFFNAAQVAVSALVLENAYVFSYLSWLTIVSAFCGLLTGLAARRTEGLLTPRQKDQSLP